MEFSEHELTKCSFSRYATILEISSFCSSVTMCLHLTCPTVMIWQLCVGCLINCVRSRNCLMFQWNDGWILWVTHVQRHFKSIHSSLETSLFRQWLFILLFLLICQQCFSSFRFACDHDIIDYLAKFHGMCFTVLIIITNNRTQNRRRHTVGERELLE